MARFAASLNATKVKTNNHPAAARAKAEIRARVLDAIGPERARVLDAFAGDGGMWRAVWHRAAHYAGCDLKWYRDERTAYVADNRRVMRALDLAAFNVFDFDAWGSPWEQVAILIARRRLAPGERLGLVLTEGTSLNLKLAGMPKALRVLTRARPGRHGKRWRLALIERALDESVQRLGARIVARWEARRKGGAEMRYIGLVLEAKQTRKV